MITSPLSEAESLDHPEMQHLVAAEGYVELDMYREADAELKKMNALYLSLPAAQEVQMRVYAGLRKWRAMGSIARKLAAHDPSDPRWSISLAYAARRSDSIEKAKAILLEAVARHPNEGALHYNLACYETQLGNLRTARRHLARCLQIDARFELHALDEADLVPLWDLDEIADDEDDCV